MKVHPSFRITAERVIDDARTDTLTTVFGPTLGIRVEQTVFNFLHEFCATYRGGFWNFTRLSNGGFFMSPPEEGAPYRIQTENHYDGKVSAEAAGIVVCLYTFSTLSFMPGLAPMAEHFHRLRMFALDHAEAGAIFAAID